MPDPVDQPAIAENVLIAPDATVSGMVTIGAGSRILPGARIVAEPGGTLTIGRNVIVMENAVIRATARHATLIGDHCLFGPHSHTVGAMIADQAFVATGAAIFHGADIGAGAEIRVNAIVHLRTRLAPDATVPIGWVAVGDPARILPPDRHDDIWALQEPLDFPGFVYGVDRKTPHMMREITQRLSERLAAPK